MAQQTARAGIRRLPFGRYPHVLFYAIEADEVVILHVRHAAQRPPFGLPPR
jgi:plasmid stabilization system protein ParE